MSTRAEFFHRARRTVWSDIDARSRNSWPVRLSFSFDGYEVWWNATEKYDMDAGGHSNPVRVTKDGLETKHTGVNLKKALGKAWTDRVVKDRKAKPNTERKDMSIEQSLRDMVTLIVQEELAKIREHEESRWQMLEQAIAKLDRSSGQIVELNQIITNMTTEHSDDSEKLYYAPPMLRELRAGCSFREGSRSKRIVDLLSSAWPQGLSRKAITKALGTMGISTALDTDSVTRCVVFKDLGESLENALLRRANHERHLAEHFEAMSKRALPGHKRTEKKHAATAVFHAARAVELREHVANRTDVEACLGGKS